MIRSKISNVKDGAEGQVGGKFDKICIGAQSLENPERPSPAGMQLVEGTLGETFQPEINQHPLPGLKVHNPPVSINSGLVLCVAHCNLLADFLMDVMDMAEKIFSTLTNPVG